MFRVNSLPEHAEPVIVALILRSDEFRSLSLTTEDDDVVGEEETAPEIYTFISRRAVGLAKASGFFERLASELFPSVTVVPDESIFAALAVKWQLERGITSSMYQLAMSSYYQRIIGMGERAVPLILRQLEREGDEPDHWFWALQALTGADPVPEHLRGDIVAMSCAWIAWGRTRYAW
jgi:hypothetical protein